MCVSESPGTVGVLSPARSPHENCLSQSPASRRGVGGAGKLSLTVPFGEWVVSAVTSEKQIPRFAREIPPPAI